ncbi:serine hydroxymethyltransferase [Candidatus Riesia sp. GBBU]|nr:serine hydroxymethyltransferase [Candidatus Riesia sp. GBBU]
MFGFSSEFHNHDKEILDLINCEIKRQEKQICLIASENYVSNMILFAQGSILTNKYAEGYPKNRYYEGCKYIDKIEEIAISRAKELFDANFVNVQPHSGSQANSAIYMSYLNPGDTVLSMKISDGGHLTHGSKVNFSGKIYNFVHYGVNKNGIIDYNDIERKSKRYHPKMIVAGSSSYSRFIDWKKIKEIANRFNSYFFVDMSHISGLVAAGIYPNPLIHADVVSSTTHKTLAGPRGGIILSNSTNINTHKRINFSVFPGTQGGPLMHIIAGKAVSFLEAMQVKFKKYQIQVVKNAKIMAKVFLDRSYKVVSGGTDSHLFLLSFLDRNFSGEKVSNILSSANIIVNKNLVPNDTRSSKVTSGIRIGSSSITKRGFMKDESEKLANWICDILDDLDNKRIIENVKNKVSLITKKFPIFKKDL